MKDYYQILGIDKTATAAQIKKAYRELAKRYHPDVNGAPNSEERFKAISEAYSVLSDKDKRFRYDNRDTYQSYTHTYTQKEAYEQWQAYNQTIKEQEKRDRQIRWVGRIVILVIFLWRGCDRITDRTEIEVGRIQIIKQIKDSLGNRKWDTIIWKEGKQPTINLNDYNLERP